MLIWTVLASLLALVIGLFALGALWSRMRQGLLRRGFEEKPAGVVYLETAVLFIGGFVLVLGLSLLPFGMGAEGTTGAFAFHELLTWSLVGVLAWPVLRTVWRPKEPPPAPPRAPPARPRPAIQPAPPREPPQRRAWRSFARGIGLDRGSGLAAEAGFGVVGYLAGLPLTVGAAIAASWLEGETESGPQGPPLFEPPETGSWVLLLLGTLSAIVWAPILEECVFRGCLYRWLRGKLRAWLAILITAAVFGLVHPYSPAGLLVVGAGGLMFGALREWRGSLVAPITAHFLHNATISLVTIAYFLALGD